MNVTNEELIARAAAGVHSRIVNGRRFGDVGAALLTTRGSVFVGVCIDTRSSTGFCAEHSAIAAMVTAGEFEIARIVAVWKDESGKVIVLPPCGRCREFIRQVDDKNLDTEVILGGDEVARLKDLLPHHGWPT